MASFDYDVLIIGSGFGGSVAALGAAEKGYRVGSHVDANTLYVPPRKFFDAPEWAEPPSGC